jgi:hypothetical protein
MPTVSLTSGSGPDEEWIERARRMNVPENEVPGIASPAQVLARNGDAALWLEPVAVFSGGIRLSVQLLLRRSDAVPDDDGANPWGGMRQVLLGVELPGGRRLVAEDDPARWLDDGDAPMLVHNGGGGGGRTFASTWYLSPLPEPGDLVAGAAFPAGRRTEGRVVLPAADLAAARAAVVRLWPWERDVDRPPPSRSRPKAPEGGWFAEAFDEPSA